MTDRNALYPRKISFTYSDNGTEKTVVGTWNYADEATVDGTPMNKATFLKDNTATALGLTGDDPKVDDAFTALASHKSRHATGGADALSPSDIGAAPASALSGYIPVTAKGNENATKVATLDSNNKVEAVQASSSFANISGSTSLTNTHAGKTLLANNDTQITFGTINDGAEFEIWNTGTYTVTISGSLFISGEGTQAACNLSPNSVCVIKKIGNVFYIAGGVYVSQGGAS